MTRALAVTLAATCFLLAFFRPAYAQDCDGVVRDDDGCRLPANTCGPAPDNAPAWIVQALTPDEYGEADFLPACRNHDSCWGTCGSDKAPCDRTFGTQLIEACLTAYPGENDTSRLLQGLCIDRGNMYWRAVAEWGGGYYADAQERACECCGESETGEPEDRGNSGGASDSGPPGPGASRDGGTNDGRANDGGTRDAGAPSTNELEPQPAGGTGGTIMTAGSGATGLAGCGLGENTERPAVAFVDDLPCGAYDDPPAGPSSEPYACRVSDEGDDLVRCTGVCDHDGIRGLIELDAILAVLVARCYGDPAAPGATHYQMCASLCTGGATDEQLIARESARRCCLIPAWERVLAEGQCEGLSRMEVLDLQTATNQTCD